MTYLTPDEVAALLAKPRSWVVATARGGGLPHYRLGREYRFRKDELDAWIEGRKAYTPADGEATPRERRRHDIQGSRTPQAVGRKRHRRLDVGGPAHPTGALRIVRAGGEGHAA